MSVQTNVPYGKLSKLLCTTSRITTVESLFCIKVEDTFLSELLD